LITDTLPVSPSENNLYGLQISKKRKRANHKINVKNLENNTISILKN